MAQGGEGDALYWFNLIITNDESDSNAIFAMIPPHLIDEVIRLLDAYYEGEQGDQGEQFDELKEETYKNDTVYGIDVVKNQDLEASAIRVTDDQEDNDLEQVQPWIRGEDMEIHHALQNTMGNERDKESLQFYNRDTGSEQGLTDTLPHLFKEQRFFSHIADGLDKTIAVAKEGFSQFYFLTRTQLGISGSMFRGLAGASPESEIQAKDITVDSGDVIERRFDNMNPFRGKFTFKTAYGPPPTASLLPLVSNATAFLDLGQKKHGPKYVIYNTSTGSLHTSSYLSAAAGKDILYNGDDISSPPYPPFSSSVITGLQFNQNSTVNYQARWEQNLTSASDAALDIDVRYVYVPYHPTVYNGEMNSLIRTRKTLSTNGNILIT